MWDSPPFVNREVGRSTLVLPSEVYPVDSAIGRRDEEAGAGKARRWGW